MYAALSTIRLHRPRRFWETGFSKPQGMFPCRGTVRCGGAVSFGKRLASFEPGDALGLLTGLLEHHEFPVGNRCGG